MSFLGFIRVACWREAGNVTRAFQFILVTVPAAIAVVISVFGGQWSKEIWPAWVWLALTVVVFVLVIVFGITRRAYFLETEREPKLEILFKAEDPWVKYTPANIPSKTNTNMTLLGESVFVRFQVKNPKNNTIVKGCRAYLRNIEFFADGEFVSTSFSDTQSIRWASRSDGGLGNLDIPYCGSFFVDLFSVDDHHHTVFIKWETNLLVNKNIFDKVGVYRFSVFVTSEDGVQTNSKLIFRWGMLFDDIEVALEGTDGARKILES